MIRPTSSLQALTHFKGATLTLEHFLLRSRAIALYRSFLRSTRDIPNPKARWETIQWFRSDFERYKHETKIDNIKDLLIQGNRLMKQMQGQMTLAGAADQGSKLRGTRVL